MSKDYKILIGGQWRKTGRALDVTSPFDGSRAGTTYVAGQAELEDALSAAQAAFETLKRYPAYQRAAVIKKVVDGLVSREEELSRVIALEAGKPIRDCRPEVRRAANTFQIALEESKRMDGTVLPLDIFPGSEGRMGIVRRFPVGVVLGISPFNFPLNLVAHKVAPAMACGCPIIIKPASKTPLSALILGEIITEAGWPDGGVNIVPCSGADAERLLDDTRIKKLTFTGSAAVGWRLKAKAGPRKVTLELGGNAGVIIHSDADIKHAAQRCAIGAFSYAGQICISVQRIYVHKDVFEEFKTAFLANCAALKSGDPLDETTDIGPMIEEAAAARTEGWVREAVAQGASLLVGGGRTGAFMEPTVLTGTRPSMKVCGEEVFAPVATLEQYNTFEEAVVDVNRGLYGLQAGVFTRDMGRILYAFEHLEVGGVIANDIPTYRVDNMPYGGVKMSGFGREGIRYAMEEMTEMRLLALKA
ncbi:MAG: aldehyde dehydrogenase [Deltaproteobacteria bacterium RIFCSPLOWO2_02_FULL_53_8]|nr:MAG: aldehyde dehydrogenase [Deltaproteobacteria bacterium RIFCSPLOWO2_02_FULL_53_8]